jgi:hypothetical protein
MTYSLFKSGLLNTNIKLPFSKALIRSVMTYACPTCESAADAQFWKLQRLKNRLLRAVGNLDKSTSVCELHVASKILHVCDYITKLYREQGEVIQNHLNTNEPSTGQREAMHRKDNRLELGCALACDF